MAADPLYVPSTYTGNIYGYENNYDYFGSGNCTYDLMVTRAASTKRIIYPYYPYSFGVMTADTYSYVNSVYNNPTYQIYRAVITSTDKVIYCDGGSTNQLYSAQFGSDSFTSVRTAFGTTSPTLGGANPYSTPGAVQMAIDENDQPIILVMYYTTVSGVTDYYVRMYVWNKTSSAWGTGVDLPSSIKTAVGGNWYNATYGNQYLGGMTYDPTTGYVIFVTSYNNNAGIFAVDKSGTLKWSDTNIWSTSNPGGVANLRIGVDVPRTSSTSAECRICVQAGDMQYGYYGGIARYNPVGGSAEKKSLWFTYNGQYGYSSGHGCLVPPNGSAANWRFLGETACYYVCDYWSYADMGSSF